MVKHPHPVTGKLVTRQRARQVEAELSGMCRYHLKTPAVASGFCEACCKKYGYGDQSGQKARWDAIDFNRPIASIAAEMGVTTAAAYYQRKRRGYVKTWVKKGGGT